MSSGQAVDADGARELPRLHARTPGTNAKGMVDSNYFIRGYAIHGYADVPVYNASHGCLRDPGPGRGVGLRLGAHRDTIVDTYR